MGTCHLFPEERASLHGRWHHDSTVLLSLSTAMQAEESHWEFDRPVVHPVCQHGESAHSLPGRKAVLLQRINKWKLTARVLFYKEGFQEVQPFEEEVLIIQLCQEHVTVEAPGVSSNRWIKSEVN